MSSSRTPFFDPHFHIWDVSGVHSADILGKPSHIHPRYTLDEYEAQVSEHAPWLDLVGGCFVEALPNGDDSVAELEWIQRQFADYVLLHKAPKIYCVVARINLVAPDVKDVLTKVTNAQRLTTGLGEDKAGGGRVRGVRQILNHNPSWPFVDRDLLEDESFLSSFALLEEYGITVFELHVNPHQLINAATRLVARYPSVMFVLNHMGCLRGGIDDFDSWREGVSQLAALPNVSVKLSGFEYPDPQSWATAPLVRRMADVLIELFGSRRCMVASNFPVTSTLGAPPEKLFPFIEKLVKELSTEAAEDIMWRTALRVYCNLDELP